MSPWRVMGTLWIWMAGIILSEAIGRTNWSPLSGMTLVGITLADYRRAGGWAWIVHGLDRSGDSWSGAATCASQCPRRPT